MALIHFKRLAPVISLGSIKISVQEEVEKAKPYVASEIMDEIRPTPTRKRLLEWQKYAEVMKRNIDRRSYRIRFARCPDEEIRALAEDAYGIKKFKEIYKAERDSIEFDGLTDPFEKSVTGWTLDYARTVKTFLVHNFPFSGNHVDTALKYEQGQLGKFENDCDDIIKIILYRASTANRKTM